MGLELRQVLASIGCGESAAGEMFPIVDEVLGTHVARHGLFMP
jgi:hypothetical protein